MIHKLFGRIRHINHATGFDAYFQRVQSNGMAGAPTIDEAKRDFKSMSNSRNMVG